jgi:AcrR family transcriptional regulator
MSEAVDPLGRSRRPPRLTDAETERRMLDAAAEMVRESGLRVSFDLLRFEDVIAAANVSRSAVYRRWPTKNHFYADLMKQLAGATHPATAAYDQGTVDLAVAVAREQLALLRTAEGRRRVLVDMCRQGAQRNFRTIHESIDWHTYIALHATLLSLPDNELQEQMHAGLQRSEIVFVQRMSQFYEQMAQLLGYRVRADLAGATFGTLATLGAAVVEGLAIAVTARDVDAERFTADPFGTGDVAEWSLAALGFTSIVVAMIEAVDVTDWDPDKLETVREMLQNGRPDNL